MKRSTAPQTPPDAASWLNQADDFARLQPTKAVASAAGVGLLINLLPIGAIVGGLIAVSLALVRPALLILGLLKAVEFLRAKTTDQT